MMLAVTYPIFDMLQQGMYQTDHIADSSVVSEKSRSVELWREGVDREQGGRGDLQHLLSPLSPRSYELTAA
jgi:hypothetical protein